MQGDQAYRVSDQYKGERSLMVPAKMYSRNAFLGALHVKSNKFVGVDLNRYVLTFASSKDEKVDKDHQIPFNHIKSLESDVSKADAGKYYLTVHADEGDLKFKFEDARDFHNLVEALRHTVYQDRPFIDADAKTTAANLDKERRADILSSDEEREHQARLPVDARAAPVEQQARQTLTGTPGFDAGFDKDLNKDLYKSNKDQIKDDFRDQERRIDQEYKVNKEIDKDAAKDKYRADLEQLKDQRDINLAYNKDQYKVNKEQIKEAEKFGKDQEDVANRARREAGYEYAKDSVRSDLNQAKGNLKADYQLYKGGTNAEKEIAKENMKQDISAGKDAVKSDLRTAKDIKDGRY